MSTNLTPKQEKAIQEYLINGGNKTAAYKVAYSTSNMKEETINKKAYELFKKGHVGGRLTELQKEIEKENKISKNKMLKELLSYVMLDPKDIFNDIGELKPLNELKPEVRRALSEVGVKTVGSGEYQRETKYAKGQDKLKAIDMINKMLGYYIPDRTETVVSESSELPSWFNGDKK